VDKYWQSIDPKSYFTKTDSSDPRLGDFARAFKGNEASETVVIAGYPDDEGITINGGRPGASKAPGTIRRAFYKMTPHLMVKEPPVIADHGDLMLNMSLSERHGMVREAAATALSRRLRWIGLGGGHDYGFPDAAAFMDVFQKESPLIINFDAHFDVRPTTKGMSSGTPFFRLLEEFAKVEFWEIGIQSQCNSQNHLKWLEDRGAQVILWDDIMSSGVGLVDRVVARMGESLLRPRPTFLSVDIDSFSSAYAPGCSQSFATGFDPAEFFRLFDLLCARLDVRALGVYEVSPPLDVDDRTSKLAALILHRFLRHQPRWQKTAVDFV
jgi:formiminoglutamase